MDILNFISWIKGGRVVNTLDPTQALLPVGQRDSRRDDGYLTNAITVADLLALVPTPPGGLTGTNYVYVAADGTDIENAIELQAAYIEATTMSPSVTNRITVIAAPGYYNFGSTVFFMNTQYIDLVSLDGNRSIIFNSTNFSGTIILSADNIYVKGVDVQSKTFNVTAAWAFGMKVENCKGGDDSFHNTGSGSGGTFIDCEGGERSFVNGTNAAGVYTDCVGGGFSFGGSGTASGTFTNCQGGNYSFGGYGTASGTFTKCIGLNYSFGGYGTASGTFTDCVGSGSSFASGATASGIFTNCVGDFDSFGASGIASGIFTNCVGGTGSFGKYGTLTGKLYYCRLTSNTFQTVSGGGITRYCLDGTNTANNQG